MKLYEFTVTDNLNLAEQEIVERALQSLDYEAQLQGWAEGYRLEQSQKPVRLSSGEIQYSFVVQGDYADRQSTGSKDGAPATSQGQTGIAATPTAEV